MEEYNFKNYLKNKRNVILIFLLINSFALVVNLLGLEGSINSQSGFDTYSKILCDIDGDYEENHLSNFWPFIDLSEEGFNDSTFEKKYFFRGLFRYYDLSEFIIYTILLFIILYFRWDYNCKTGRDFNKK